MTFPTLRDLLRLRPDKGITFYRLISTNQLSHFYLVCKNPRRQREEWEQSSHAPTHFPRFPVQVRPQSSCSWALKCWVATNWVQTEEPLWTAAISHGGETSAGWNKVGLEGGEARLEGEASTVHRPNNLSRTLFSCMSLGWAGPEAHGNKTELRSQSGTFRKDFKLAVSVWVTHRMVSISLIFKRH